MLNEITRFLVGTMDIILGWSLHFPRFTVLIIVALGEALTITYIQKFATNQDRLRRMKSDKTRLKQLIKEAKRNKDREALKRYRGTMGSIGTLHMRMELAPILVSLLPIVFLATWAFMRLGYVPPTAASPIVIKAYFPRDDIGKLTHILPTAGLDAPGGWIQKIVEQKNPDGKVTGGSATWQLQCTAGGGEFQVPISFDGRVVNKELLVNGRSYATPIEYYENTSNDDGIAAAELLMPEYKPLGIIPGIPAVTFPPWLVGDLIMVIPLSLLLKPLLRIY